MIVCSPVDEVEAQAFPCRCHSPAFARLCAILDQKFSRRAFLTGAAAVLGSAALWPKAASAGIPDAPKTPIAFTNAKLFDGKSSALIEGLRVVVDGAKIKAIEPAAQPVALGMRVIDCGGRTLMPGLIDAHWHAMMAAVPGAVLATADVGYLNLVAADQAEKTLLRGFTTVRDMAGPSFGLKLAIDTGLTAGPRIFPSGAMISQTGGHGDARLPYDVPAAPDAPLSRGDATGLGTIADGVDQVLKRSREQLMLGASQLKLAAGGGVLSNYDPIDVSEYTEPEFHAAVDAATNWGTYVAVHAYTPLAIKTAIRAGVASIEHGHLMDEETAKVIADQGVWLSTQPFGDDFAAPFPAGSINRAKQLQVFAGTDRAYGFAKQYKLKTAWGTDVLFDAKLCETQGAQVARLAKWYAPAEALKMVTSVNAELCAMSGPRNPYPGKLGVVEAGAYADVILIDGDPIADLRLLADPAKTLKLIMKDGRIYKDALA